MIDPIQLHPLNVVKNILDTTVDVCKTINYTKGDEKLQYLPTNDTATCVKNSSVITINGENVNHTSKFVRDGELERWFSDNGVIEPSISDYIHARINNGYKVKYIRYNNKRTKVRVKYISDCHSVTDVYRINK